MHVECVAWISERKDMLYTPFYLLSILAYLRYMDMGYRFKYFVPVFVLFLFSLFSKTEAVTLPLVLLLVDVYKGRKTSAKTIVEKLPLLAFSLFFGILGVLSQQTDGVIGHHAAEPYTFIDHVFLFTSVPAFYVVKLFAPFHLSSMHFYPHLQGGLLPWMYYASLPFVLCVAWLAVRRSPLRKEKIFGVSFFLVTIYIMPQIIYTGPSLTPERYSYIPYIGFFYIIGQWITMNQSAKWRKPLLLVYASVMILFSVLTWLRIDTWKTSKALFADMIAKNDDAPDCAYFYMVLGNSSLDEKDYNQAIEDYGHVIAQHKDNVLAYVQRGTAYSELGNANAGIADFSEAIRLDPNHPMYYYNRASLRAGMGDINGAVEDYTSCLKIDGTNSDAYTFRGALRMRANDSIGACEDWKRGAMLGSSKAKALSDRICH